MNDIQIVAGNGPSGPNEAMIDEVKAETTTFTWEIRSNHLERRDIVLSESTRLSQVHRTKLTLAGLQGSTRIDNTNALHFVKLRNPDQVDAMAAKINTELPETRFNQRRKSLPVSKRRFPSSGVFLRVLVGLAAVVGALVVMCRRCTQQLPKEPVR